VHVADPAANAEEHLKLICKAGEAGVELLVFPELSLSAYAIDDLHLQSALLDAVEVQLPTLAQAAGEAGLAVVVGAPLRHGDRLLNCAVLLAGGQIVGAVPKTYLPNYREYYEKRWFSSGDDIGAETLRVSGADSWIGTRLLFQAEDRQGFLVGLEICEDFWSPLPPSTRQALAGARILCNLSASNIVIGKAEERAMLCASQSARAMGAYVFAASGWGESTTDLAWDGQATIHELGARLATGERFSLENHLTVADIDVDRIGLERMRTGTFADCARRELDDEGFVRLDFRVRPTASASALVRPLDRFPFVPDDPARLDQDCFEAFNIQVQGLMRRLKATECLADWTRLRPCWSLAPRSTAWGFRALVSWVSPCPGSRHRRERNPMPGP
jgi:NAD+ synthase (glutamine-hydrolysing)